MNVGVNDQNHYDELDDVTHYFQGSYTRSVDDGGRFNLPFRFRKCGGAAGEESFVVTQGPDGLLVLMPHTEWLRAFQRLRRSKLDKKKREELRRLSHNSEIVVPDGQGRVKVDPEALAQYGIQEKILIIGMGSFMELWNPNKHADHHASLTDPDQEFLDDFFR